VIWICGADLDLRGGCGLAGRICGLSWLWIFGTDKNIDVGRRGASAGLIWESLPNRYSAL